MYYIMYGYATYVALYMMTYACSIVHDRIQKIHRLYDDRIDDGWVEYGRTYRIYYMYGYISYLCSIVHDWIHKILSYLVSPKLSSR